MLIRYVTRLKAANWIIWWSRVLSCKAIIFLATRTISRILRNPKVHYRAHSSSPLVPVWDQINPCVISSFRHEVDEDRRLLALTQQVVAIPYRSFGTNCWSHSQWSRRDFWPLNVGTKGCPKTSVRNYHYLLRNSPEERSFLQINPVHSL
jgi:hypothetical protein